MHFLPDVFVPCDVCKGKRFNRETLEVRFRGMSIADVLDLTVEDAVAVFENQPRIAQKLITLADVGLGYVHLGQSATTLSGGEAQRVKLATELSKRDTGRTLYILDEPTTGLHFEDVRVLLEVLHKLVDKGNTVLVIEHNLDVIKTADWIVDLGPDGGVGGGQLVASGTPEQVAAEPRSYTGQFLATMLKGPAARNASKATSLSASQVKGRKAVTR
jgi:excinuclease ABC subunit A